jgi:transglutaminase-like putative cysteine protease
MSSLSNHPAIATPFDPLRRTIRPIGAYMLYGLASDGANLLAVDALQGYILRINPGNQDATVLNPQTHQEFTDATGLALQGDRLWFTREQGVYWCHLTDFQPQLFVTLPYPADGLTVWQSTLYVSCQKAGYIYIYEAASGTLITRFSNPGVGTENLTVRDEELWVCDRIEQTVYCMDRATGDVQFSILTPFASPTGLTFHKDAQTGQEILYVSYVQEEAYVRDQPNSDPPYELAFRDRTFIHPLHFHYNPQKNCTLSNGYLVEMNYVEELSPLDEIEIDNLEWRIALPVNTPRQRVLQIEPVGMPFTEELHEGQPIAVFKFDKLRSNQGGLFGWRALLELRCIKYFLTPRQVENIPPLPVEFQSRYLVDNDDLAMDNPLIRAAAREAIGTETNLLRKILKIRNYVYDRLSYGIKPHIDTPDVALKRGVGSCGEYVGILLALARLNGIACRTVGRYKCPAFGDRQNMPLEPEFNHVWIEFYIPGLGWFPMESNVDDVVDGGPYPTRFFMGLPWYHVEMSKDIRFEVLATPDDAVTASIGELALNHVRFYILGELPPPQD